MESVMLWRVVLCGVLLLAGVPTHADDRCASGPKHQWKSKTALEHKLVAQGWKLRRIRVDDGCYEAYGWDAKGRGLKARFHPLTLEQVGDSTDD
jgi:hypothetical protein